MINQIRRPIYLFTGVLLASVTLCSCIIQVNAKDKQWDINSNHSANISSTNKSIHIERGQNLENITTVNGSMKIEDNVTAKNVSSVNGKTNIGENVYLESVKSVNGQISIAEGFTAKGSVSTVNGSITVEKGGQIGEAISSVNGSITIRGVLIENDIVTVNGDLNLTDASHVKGDIHYKGNNKNNVYKKYPTLYISADTKVDGNIILERPVELQLENTSLQSKVKRVYSESLPEKS